MANMLQNGFAWLTTSMFTHLAQTVTYARGMAQLEVSAVLGSSEYWGGDAGDTHDRHESMTFDIKASALTSLGEPARGDTITDDAGGEWVVDAPSDHPKPWEYIDPAREVYRISVWQGRS